MTLEGMDLKERRRVTRVSPILIVSSPKRGKSRSIEKLTPEDRMRTVVVDIEGKGFPNLLDEDFFRVVRLKPQGVIPPAQQKLYVDYDNVKYKTLAELKDYTRSVMASDKVDRVILDSFTALVDDLEYHYVTVSNGLKAA